VRQAPANHCFNIRHQPVLPAEQEVEEEAERGHDSIVTSSLLQLTSFATSTATTTTNATLSNSSKGVQRNRPRRRLAAGGLEKVEESPRGVGTRAGKRGTVRPSLSSDSTASTATTTTTASSAAGNSRPRGTRSAKLRSQKQHGDERRQKMRHLWEQSGMKTNGRKLLLDSEDDEYRGGQDNLAFDSDEEDDDDDNDDDDDDSSLVSLPQVAHKQYPTRYGRRRRHSGSSSTMTVTSYESERSQVRAGRLRAAKTSTSAKQQLTDTDTADMASQTKQVRFIRESHRSGGNNNNNNNNNRLLYDKVNPTVWVGSRKIYESYYGTTALSGVGGFKSAGGAASGGSYPQLLSHGSRAGSLTGSGFTLVEGDRRGSQLKRRERRRRRMKTCCKAMCLFLLLATFLLVIVAVSIFLTKGKNHFGSM
jgi:hypothetical protein